MSKLYVIGKVGFEYNDEIYARPEGDEVKPISAYRSQETAKKTAAAANLAELKELLKPKYSHDGLGMYGYNLVEIINEHNFGKVCKILEIEEKNFSELLWLRIDINEFSDTIKDANDEQLMKIMDCMSLKFFTVSEVELED
jgi:hypothetical protein